MPPYLESRYNATAVCMVDLWRTIISDLIEALATKNCCNGITELKNIKHRNYKKFAEFCSGMHA